MSNDFDLDLQIKKMTAQLTKDIRSKSEKLYPLRLFFFSKRSAENRFSISIIISIVGY